MSIVRLPEALSSTPIPSVIVNLVCLADAGAIQLLKASPVEKDVAGVPTMTAAEAKLDQVPRSVDQVVEVFHFMEGEDSPRRVLCPRGALFSLAGRCSSDGRLLCEA